jgi:hypothetical protein
MPTTMRPPVHAGKNYKVRFSNDDTSTGVVIAIVGWVPNHQSSVPDPQQKAAAPAGSVEITGVVPSDVAARRMTIVIDLDAGERGNLEVFEDDVLHFREPVSQTTTFGMVVI